MPPPLDAERGHFGDVHTVNRPGRLTEGSDQAGDDGKDEGDTSIVVVKFSGLQAAGAPLAPTLNTP